MAKFLEAILDGTDSAFDSPDWLYFPPPEYSTECTAFLVAYRVIMQQMIRIPRLVRLVRQLKQDPCNIDLGVDAVALAEKLFLSNIDPIVDGWLRDYCEWVPTEAPDLAYYFPQSLRLAKINIFETLTRYCSCRIVLAGLCRTLKEIFPFSPVLEMAPFAQDELRAASFLAMSTQYAEELVDPMPLGPWTMILPLQLSFGSWWRAQRDDGSVSHEEIEKASFMKEWSRQKSNEMLRIWNGLELSASRIEVEIVAVEEGGPLMSWMQRKVAPLC